MPAEDRTVIIHEAEIKEVDEEEEEEDDDMDVSKDGTTIMRTVVEEGTVVEGEGDSLVDDLLSEEDDL